MNFVSFQPTPGLGSVKSDANFQAVGNSIRGADDPSARFDTALDDGQTQPHSAGLGNARGINAIKGVEKFLEFKRRYTRAIVVRRDHQSPSASFGVFSRG